MNDDRFIWQDGDLQEVLPMIPDEIGEEMRAAARWCAGQGLTGVEGDPLPDWLSMEAWQAIDADLGGFRRLIAEERAGLEAG